MKLQDYIMNKPILETQQLTLRPLRQEDVADLKEWLGNSSIYQFWGKRPGKSDLNPALLFQKPERPTKSFHWGIVHKQDNKVIGDMWVYLIENDRMAKVAFRLSPAYQGNRFMTEALARVAIFCFEETELQRLWADVHTQNIASYKTLEKVGFKREGLIREGKMVNIYCDYYLYGMTKADYIEITDNRVPPFSLLSTEKGGEWKSSYEIGKNESVSVEETLVFCHYLPHCVQSCDLLRRGKTGN